MATHAHEHADEPVVFHKLLSVEEALQKLNEALGGAKPLGTEKVSLERAIGRVLAEDLPARVDSPPFDRSEVDGYAVRAESTYGAEEDKPVILRIVGTSVVGRLPKSEVMPREAVEIATGAPIPRGANAVVMVEYTKSREGSVDVYRSVTPAENVSQTGSDIMFGDVTIRKGTLITPREVAVLGAVGRPEVTVYRRPSVAVFSTGDELVPTSGQLEPGRIFDVNGPTIRSMVEETGATAEYLGILPDDYESLRAKIEEATFRFDVVLTSGSTSAGIGDMIYRVFDGLGAPGLLVHGLRIRPGKPTVAAVAKGKLIVGLPGFPVSAMMAFSALVKPIIAQMLGLQQGDAASVVTAEMVFRIQTGRGARHFVPISLVQSYKGFAAYPLLGGSGAVSTVAMADGYLEVPETTEFVAEGESVQVKLFSTNVRIAELNIIGSNCPGIDLIIELSGKPTVKLVNVGSTAGWLSVKRGEADIAGTHLLDETTMAYNVGFMGKYDLNGKAVLVRGYGRRQGFLVAKGNPKRIEGFKDLFRDGVVFINRAAGSGTRALIDHHLTKLNDNTREQVRGYAYEARTHSAVAAAVAHGRADVGVAIEPLADAYDLDFIPVGEEIFDFLIPKHKMGKKAVQQFLRVLSSSSFREKLPSRIHGYKTLPDSGKIIA